MSKQKSKEQVLIENMLGSKTVSFYPDFARALGSVPAGVFMAQGFFLQFKSSATDFVEFEGRKYFLHTMKEWEAETALSEDQQIRARKVLVESGIMKEKLAGLPAKLHYHFDFEVLAEMMFEYKNRSLQEAVKPGNKFPGNPGTGNRETREQVTGKPGNNYIGRELKEKIKEKEEENSALPLSSSPSTEPSLFPVEEKPLYAEKIPPAAPAAPRYPHQVYGVTSTAPIEAFDLGAGIESIRGNFQMKDAFSMSYRVPAQLFDEYLKDFHTQEAGVGTIHHNQRELNRHFLNYALKRHQNEQARKAAAPAANYAPPSRPTKTSAFVE